MLQAPAVFNQDQASQLIAQLQDKFSDAFNPADVFGLTVAQYDGGHIVLTAPLDKNLNDKGSAFAGSLYSVSVLAGWSLLYLKLLEEGLNCDVVVVKSQAYYLRPLLNDLHAECCITPLQVKRFLSRLRRRGRAGIDLEVVIKATPNTQAVKLRVKYAALCKFTDKPVSTLKLLAPAIKQLKKPRFR